MGCMTFAWLRLYNSLHAVLTAVPLINSEAKIQPLLKMAYADNLVNAFDGNDRVDLDVLRLGSVPPPNAHILFILNAVINISFRMLCFINCFYNGDTVKPFEPGMFA